MFLEIILTIFEFFGGQKLDFPVQFSVMQKVYSSKRIERSLKSAQQTCQSLRRLHERLNEEETLDLCQRPCGTSQLQKKLGILEQYTTWHAEETFKSCSSLFY